MPDKDTLSAVESDSHLPRITAPSEVVVTTEQKAIFSSSNGDNSLSMSPPKEPKGVATPPSVDAEIQQSVYLPHADEPHFKCLGAIRRRKHHSWCGFVDSPWLNDHKGDASDSDSQSETQSSASDNSDECDDSAESALASESDSDSEYECSVLSKIERKFILSLPAAEDEEDLDALFLILPYCRGEHSVDEIMWRLQMSRNEILAIVQKFSQALELVLLP